MQRNATGVLIPVTALVLALTCAEAPALSGAERLARFESRFEHTGETVDCVNTRRIRDVEVIDDRHILFRLGGGRYALNALPRSCPHLASRRQFGYSLTSARLCGVDTITVIDDFRPWPHAGNFLAGPRCGLGAFELVVPLAVP